MNTEQMLDRMPDEIRNMMWGNIEQQETLPLLKGRGFDNESKFLLAAFGWTTSYEGYDFWSSYYDFLCNFEDLK